MNIRARYLLLSILSLFGLFFIVKKSILASCCPCASKPSINQLRNQDSTTPVIYQHQPITVSSDKIVHIDLNSRRLTNHPNYDNPKDNLLILTPLRDAAPYLPNYFKLLESLTYPRNLIDVGILVSDTQDETVANIAKLFDNIQRSNRPFRSVKIVSKDFGAIESQDVEMRHAFEYQGLRRKLLGKARNFLLASTLQDHHDWVLWRDVDIVGHPETIIEDLQSHNRDIIVPNIFFHRIVDDKLIEGGFDYNSWQESEQGLKLASTLSKDTVIAEGYPEFETGRRHMVRLGDVNGDPREEMPLDAIGGVCILVKADVHRAGINFPSYAFENQAETEGFGKMAKRAGYEVYGLPHYIVYHIDTEEKSRY